MVRVPCCEKLGVKKGPWTPEEDHKLVTYIQNHGHSSWRALPKQAGLSRCGKSCRLRWTNYLRPGIKRGNFSAQEENTIIQLHALLGNRWSTISTHLPGRTDNEIKNHWNTRLRKKMLKMGLDPVTHRPWVPPHQHQPPQPSYLNTLLLSLLQGAPAAADVQSSLLSTLLLGNSPSFANNTGLFPSAPGQVPQNNNPRGPSAPPASAVLPPPLDPALLAAAETRLVLDCLKCNNAENQASTSDHHINHLLTRLLLLKLLQDTNNHTRPSSTHPLAPSNPSACCENRAPIPSIAQHADPRSSLIPAEQVLQNQGVHPPGSMPEPAASNRAQMAAAPPLSSAYVSVSDPIHSNMPNTMLLNMFNTSYQQRLLQTLPFLTESVIEPCTSVATTDHLSSTSPSQLSQGSFPNCRAELTTPNGSVPSQQSPPWPGQGGGDNQMLPSGTQAAQMIGACSLIPKQPLAMESGAQLLGGAGMMHDVAVSKAPTLMTWEEHLMREQKGGDRDLASSSTVSSSTLSSGSQSHAAPNTPSTNFNIQEYWSNLLNLISASK